MDYFNVNGLLIPAVGLGTFSMHGEELRVVVSSAVRAGYRLFDTAFRYGNERELGEILAENSAFSDNVVVSTKLSGLQYHGEKRWLYLNKQSPRRSIRASLTKLGKSCQDIYLLHSPFKNYHLAYYKLLKEKSAGKIKVLGVSGFKKEQLICIKQFCGCYPMVNMIEMHPYHASKELVDFCQENGIQVIARSPFAHGIILKELSDNVKICNIAVKYGKSIPQIILRWIIQQDVVAMHRTQNVIHLNENIDVFDFELDDNEMNIMYLLNKDLSFGVVNKNLNA